jgi:AraC family transcriptional regulator, glycine betaine-responsive activator
VRENPKHLGFLIFPGFPMACLTSAIEPLRAANEITGRRAFRWSVLSEDRAPVASSAEVKFEPTLALSEASGLDYLFFLSSPSGRFRAPRKAGAEVRWLARQGVRLGGFSGGIFPLARAGLLSGHACSVHWCYEAAFIAEFPDIPARQAVMTIDRARITAAGATAVFDLMLRLIEDDLGPEIMTEVACWFQHPVVRGPDVIQRIPGYRADRTQDTLPLAVARAIRLFSDHIEDPLPIAEAARRVGLSARQLDRAFRRATGMAPLRYYRMIRMKKARQLVQFTDETVTAVALATGYASSTPLVRHYRAEFGLSPQADRAARNDFRQQGTQPRFAAEG